jgi:transposase
LGEGDQQMLSLVSDINPTLKTMVELAQQFSTMVCQRQPDGFDQWLDQAAQSGISALRSFANGLRNNSAAVRAALTLIWSNGWTEGFVNRLKAVKRQS